MDERKNQQKLESSWIMSRHLDKAMNHDDVYLLNQEIETIEMNSQISRSYECESIEPMLWACSLVTKLTPASKFTFSDYHSLLIGTPMDELCKAAELRAETQISLQRDIYMLWYWRSRINHEFDVRKGNSIADAIADIFSPQEFEAAKKIKRIQGDFAFGGRPFSQLTPKEKYSMELRMRWRYHALEWILNDESWYDTSTDT